MNSFLLDTNVISHVMKFPNGPVAARFATTTKGERFLSSVVVAEIRYGLHKAPAAVRLAARAEEVMRRCQSVVPFSESDGQAYAKLRTQLEKCALPFDANDLLIASQALQRDWVLVTHDQQMMSYPETGLELRVEDWQTAPI